MKIRKLIAGLSAAALAATTMSLASFADEGDGGDAVDFNGSFTAELSMKVTSGTANQNIELFGNGTNWEKLDNFGKFDIEGAVIGWTVTNADGEEVDGGPVPTFNAQFYVMGNNKWDWKSVLGEVGQAGISLEGDAAELAAQSRHEEDEAIGSAGMQVWVDNAGDFEAGTVITATFEYNITHGDALHDEVTYNNVVEGDKVGEYPGQWSSQGEWTGDLSRIIAADGLRMTIEYETLEDEGAGYSFKPFDMHNWTGFGYGKVLPDGTILEGYPKNCLEGVGASELDSDATDEEKQAELEEKGALIQSDGFIKVPETADGKLVLTLNEEGVKRLLEIAEADPNGVWYGLGIQVNAVNIKKVVWEWNATSPESFGVHADASYNQSVVIDPAAYGVTADSGFQTATIGLKGLTLEEKGLAEGEGSGWNDWCTYKIIIHHEDGSDEYAAVIGDQVSWATTVYEDPENEDNNIVIEVEDCYKAEAGTGKIEVTAPYKTGDTYEIVALGWDGFPDDPYIHVVGVAFDDAEVDWSEEPHGEVPTDDSQDEPSDSEGEPTDSEGEPTDSEGEPTDSEGEPTDSQNDSTAAPTTSTPDATSTTGTTSKAQKADDKNVNTGTVALGLGVLTLAGAAVVVTKKRF